MKMKVVSVWSVVVAAGLLLIATSAAAQGGGSLESHTQTVLGPRNQALADGAEALVNGYAQRGVELTEKGLAMAHGKYEKKAALSNLCAGYLMVKKLNDALAACDEVIAMDPKFWRAYNNRALVLMELGRFEESEADVARGQELRPKSHNLKLTKAKLLDHTDPVEPLVEIDERRSAVEENVATDNKL